MSQTELPPTCQAPGCHETADLASCQKLDFRLVCPTHRTVVDGAIVCCVCQERLAELLAQTDTEVREQADARQAMSRDIWRGLILRNLAGFIPAAIALGILVFLIESRVGSQFRELYPFVAIALVGAMIASAAMNWSAPTARGGDFGSGWRAGKRYDR